MIPGTLSPALLDAAVFGSLHVVDLVVIAAYFFLVIYLGQRAAKKNRSEDGFFLANRSFGKLFQFFLNFGQSTDPQGAVSTVSIVYQEGISGVWLTLQTLFVNPYYWFMNAWFRRARLTTVADLFEDRLGSRPLARFYSIFQILTAVFVVNGFANLIAYKISASLIVKPEAEWTAAEVRSVEGYRAMKQLEHEAKAAPLAPVDQSRLQELHEADARGELHSFITLLHPWSFYLGFNLIIGAYIVLEGMHGTTRNEVLQGTLTLVLSTMLIPVGLHAVGGWHALSVRIPASMFEIFGSATSQINGWTMMAILFVTLVQAPANINNMSVSGSARNEFAARFGAVSGTYAKRLMIILWAFTGLIAVALFRETQALSDPDAVWGTMARQLLGPGLLGLMLAGVLAGSMSTGAMHTMAVSGLFVRNVYRHLRPDASDREALAAGRWAIVVSLAAGIVAASAMSGAFTVIQLFLLMNVPFGAAVLFVFQWRRLTPAAVWTAVVMSALVTLVAPFVVPLVPALARAPDATALSTSATGGQPEAVYFESVVHVRADDLHSPLEGRGRFHAELYLLHLAGFDLPQWSASARFTARFLVSGLVPFLFLLAVSLFTRGPPAALVDQFYGKMKTPVGATPELEIAALGSTRRDPHRFDATKLFPRSSWELTKWDRTDTLGFLACCAVSGTILLLFMALVHATR